MFLPDTRAVLSTMLDAFVVEQSLGRLLQALERRPGQAGAVLQQVALLLGLGAVAEYPAVAEEE